MLTERSILSFGVLLVLAIAALLLQLQSAAKTTGVIPTAAIDASNDLTAILEVHNGLNKRVDSPHGSHGSSQSLPKIADEHEISVYAAKGEKMLSLISQTADQATQAMEKAGLLKGSRSSQSKFDEYKDLSDNGWETNAAGHYKNFDWTEAAEYAPIQNALQALKLPEKFTVVGDEDHHRAGHESQDRGPNFVLSWNHAEDKMVFQDRQPSKKYWATDAEYTAVYNVKDGAIFALRSDSPSATIEDKPELKQRHPNIVPPPLNHWSDVVSLEYVDQAHNWDQDPAKLKYVFQVKSQNLDTRALALGVLKAKDYDWIPTWKKKAVFDADIVGGKALIGSPLGEGVAWMLIQHKVIWHAKRFKSVTVFLDDGSARSREKDDQHPTLIFELEDYDDIKAGPA